MKKILIATGGTGGHKFVALALSERLHNFGIKTVFTTSRYEQKTSELHPCYQIRAKGFVGLRFSLINWSLFLISLFESFLILLRERPNAMLGTGSYASVAPAFVSRLFFIPLFITEIDSIPGLATKFLSFFADKIYLTFKSAESSLPKRKTELFGCPVRKLRVMEKTEAKKELRFNPDRLLILVFGGSGGALSINNLILKLLPELPEIQFLLSTGRRDYEMIEKKIERNGVHLCPFITDMGQAYSASDIIISRAGALTLAEIQRFRKPAIFIPYPYAAKKHQKKNTAIFEKMGAVRVLDDPSIQQLKEEIIRLKDRETRKLMADSFPQTDDSAERIAQDIKKSLTPNHRPQTADHRPQTVDHRPKTN